jgi:hypothetical protein
MDVQETERAERAARDKARYHPFDPKDYGSPVGMPDVDAHGDMVFVCVGCWYCCPEEAER